MLKSGKKRSERLLCFPLIDHTVLQLSPQEAFLKDCSSRICSDILKQEEGSIREQEKVIANLK